MKKPIDFDEYIAGFPKEVQKLLVQMCTTIGKAAPTATEVISYGMPAYKLNGMLLYFAAHSKHIGLYPYRTAITAFQDELTTYKTAKGSIQFPFEKPLPLRLISRIVKFRVAENLLKAEMKKKKK